MKKTKVQLSRLSLQKSAITVLNTADHARIIGGATLDGCEVPVSAGANFSCIGHTCESWNSEMPSCRHCAAQ